MRKVTKVDHRKEGNTKLSVKKKPKRKNQTTGPLPEVTNMRAKEFVLSCIGGGTGVRKIILKTFAQACKGSAKHQEMLLNYILGKPVDRISLEANEAALQVLSQQPIIKILADTIRVDRLERDAKDRVQELERIKEAEVILDRAAMGPAAQGEDLEDSVAQELEAKLKKAQ